MLSFRDLFMEERGLVDPFVKFLKEKISERFDSIPNCLGNHYDKIVKKMITWKWHHYSKFLNRDLIEINRSEIENEANSSRTTKAWAMLSKPEDPFRGNVPANTDGQNPENADHAESFFHFRLKSFQDTE